MLGGTGTAGAGAGAAPCVCWRPLLPSALLQQGQQGHALLPLAVTAVTRARLRHRQERHWKDAGNGGGRAGGAARLAGAPRAAAQAVPGSPAAPLLRWDGAGAGSGSSAQAGAGGAGGGGGLVAGQASWCGLVAAPAVAADSCGAEQAVLQGVAHPASSLASLFLAPHGHCPV